MKKNYLYAILTVFIWGTMATVGKILVSNIPSLEALCIGSAFAFVFIIIGGILLQTFWEHGHSTK